MSTPGGSVLDPVLPGGPATDAAPRREAEARPEPPTRAWRVRDDILIALLLSGAALLLRLPYLWDVPRFTDELQEILWALAIYRGEILPLTAVDSYYGPLWSYLLAAIFALGADPVLAPRLLAALLAALTVGLVYLVASDMAGRRAALLTAALLGTSAGHVIINSHTARSNSITPLLTTAVVWLVYRAVRSGRGWPLAPAGLVFGLALQTHVSVITLAPGLAAGLLLMRPRLLAGRWVWIAAALFAIGYANMIVYNLENQFWSVVHARRLQEGYVDGRGMTIASYFENLAALLQSLSRLLSGTIDIPTSFARFPYSLLALGGLALAARAGNPLPFAFCASAILILPYFNPRYGPILSGRYLIPLLPFGYLGISLALIWLAGRVQPRLSRSVGWLSRGVAVAVVLFPLVHLGLYYREVLDDGRTNAPLFALAAAAERAREPGDLVLLDEQLAQEQLTAGGTDLKALRFLLEGRGVAYEVAKLDSASLDAIAAEHPTVLVVTDVRKRPTLRREFTVEARSPEIESASGSDRRYAVYRLVARPPSG